MDETLRGNTIPSQSGLGNKVNERVLYPLKISRIRASKLDAV